MYLNIIVKLTLGTAGLFLIIRIIGKKAVSELTPFDLIYFLVLGGMLEGSLFHPEVSIVHLLFALALWGVIVYAIERTSKKTMKTSKILQGEPSVLIYEGKANFKELERNNIDLEQLRALLRQHGCFTMHDVNYAILEIDGKVSVIRKDQDEKPSILLVDEGRVDHDTLESIEKDEGWLREQLQEKGYGSIEDLFYCEWVPGKGIYAASYQENVEKDYRLDG